MKPALKIQGLTVDYEDAPVIWDINVTIPQGTFVALLGPNGAGKTTFIKALLGFVPKTSGNISILGHPLEHVLGKIAYIPQRQSIDWNFPITVKELVLMGCYHRVGIFRAISKEEKKRAEKCLQLVHMQDLMSRQINELSGGQQQRVFLARALMQDAHMYFLDEALSGVDHASEEIIMNVLNDLRVQGKTILMVYHDLDSVQKYFDYVMLLNVRLVAAGTTHEVFTEENLQEAYGKGLAIYDETRKLSISKLKGLR